MEYSYRIILALLIYYRLWKHAPRRCMLWAFRQLEHDRRLYWRKG